MGTNQVTRPGVSEIQSDDFPIHGAKWLPCKNKIFLQRVFLHASSA
jgi:hypothetical protein